MEECEEDLILAELGPLAGLRLLHLHHHFGASEYLLRAVDDHGTGGTVHVVIGGDTEAGTCLHQDLMPVRHIFTHRARRQTDAIFVVLNLGRNADAHWYSSFDYGTAITLWHSGSATVRACSKIAQRTIQYLHGKLVL